MVDETVEQPVVDVWSRTASKYRIRAILLLLVNIVLFAGLGSFAYWLRTGVNFAPTQDGYWQIVADTFMPKGDAHLGNFVLFPIRLDVVPLHGIVVGLLLAALVSVPILIAILYRFPCCLPFIFIVAFLAVMPWLAINITGACVIATVKPLRFRFRYASALLGLVLVLLYFYGASRQAAPIVEHYAPADRLKFMAPWILATFASCLIMGIVLFFARLVNYRPGVVAPLLLVCFAVPVVVFEWHVGRDELYYRLLEKRFYDEFGERDGAPWFDRITFEAWQLRPPPRPTLEEFRKQVDFRISLELESALDMRTAFAQQKDDFVDECRHFIRHFPDSRYAPNVLYLEGQALDARMDVEAFRKKKVLATYFDFPMQTDQSELIWRKVIYNAPEGSSIAAVGRYKLAMLNARDGKIARALESLDELVTLYGENRTSDKPPTHTGAVKKALTSAPPDASLNILVENIVFEGRRLRDLLLENANDPRYGVRPLCGAKPGEPRQPGLLQLDPHERFYKNNLRDLLRAYPGSMLADNIKLRLALLSVDPVERVERLQTCVDSTPPGDSRPEALYHLGIACLDAGMDARGRGALTLLAGEYAGSMWAELGEKRMRALPPPKLETAP
ncbi:MAG: hypothetical protein H6817_10125 [Phycisphaerales bacterium]|nr:hypothetical protein [Phycisphaerales bacterium]